MKTNFTMEQLKKEYQFMLSKFSHELRNPIALISSELQMMESMHPDIADYENWEDILDNIEYIKELLNELSNYNNADRIAPKSTDMKEYLENILSSTRPTMDYLGITLEADLASALPTLEIDRVKIRQALLNLLRNAQESISHSHGKITVFAIPYENGICISITDNGCGISAEQKAEIFSPFITFKSGGTGLGLAVTRQVVEAHHGRIEADGTPGQGSTFRIFLG